MTQLALPMLLALVACATMPAPVVERDPGPETVSLDLSSDRDETARRQCGADARPETDHHESNVVAYRCLREAN